MLVIVNLDPLWLDIDYGSHAKGAIENKANIYPSIQLQDEMPCRKTNHFQKQSHPSGEKIDP
jgi:hypothetical protein